MGAGYSQIITCDDGLSYGLNTTDLTAKIIKSPKAKGDIFISRSIFYDSNEYIIVGIDQESFHLNMDIHTVEFSEDSNISLIDKEAFSGSSIKSISFPISVKQICENSFSNCTRLKSVYIPHDSKLSKIEKRAFSNSGIESITIPSHLKQICEFSFSNCKELKTVFFPENSELQSIDKYAFYQSSIEKFSFPANLKEIGAFSFSNCKELKTVFFPENSELHSIDKFAFVLSSVESLTLPQKVENLADGWCCMTPNLHSIMISPNNRLLALQDDERKMLFGKSKSSLDVYDVLILACHDFRRAVIPSLIRTISSYAFSGSRRLKTVEFSEGSELTTIRQCAFFDSAIETIFIPYHVKEICESSFSNCANLNRVEFADNSELAFIGREAFSETSIYSFKFPPLVRKIEKRALANCKKLTNVEFLGDNLTVDASLFENCERLVLVSFPNSTNIKVNTADLDLVSGEMSLFVSPNTILKTGF